MCLIYIVLMFEFIKKRKLIITLFAILLILLLLLAFPLQDSFHSNIGYIRPVYIKDYNIYDVYYNDNGYLLIIMEYTNDPEPIYYYDDDKKRYIKFNAKTDLRQYVNIYKLKTEYKQSIKLKINNKEIYIKINKYPVFKNDIIFSTLVKNENDYVIQWIEFHKRIGVSRFVIYDNSENDTLEQLLKPRIDNNEVCLIKWPYQYWSGKMAPLAQIAQMNHSLYAFQNCRLIGFFDIDEYINMQVRSTLPEIFDHLISKKNINTKTIPGFKLYSKFFYNTNRLKTDGYKFLNITTCGDIIKDSRTKNFIIPKNVATISDPHLIIDGPKEFIVDENLMYFNHYSFLNKPDFPGLDEYLEDDSIKLHLNF